MQFTISLVTGLLVGAIVLVVLGRGLSARGAPPAGPTALGWTAYGVGILAVAALVLMMAGSSIRFSVQASIGLMAAAMVLSVGALVKRDRHWPTWVGFGVAAVPAFFWILFAAGEFINPH